MWHSKDVRNTVKQVHKLGEQNNSVWMSQWELLVKLPGRES